MLTIAYDGTDFHGWQKQRSTAAAAQGDGDDADWTDDAHLVEALASPGGGARGAAPAPRAASLEPPPTPPQSRGEAKANGPAAAAHAEPLRTVQEVLERAVRESVREPAELIGASRTDSGVHARMQVAAFTRTDPLREEDRVGPPDDRLALAINSRLPSDVLVTSCRRVHRHFDPIGHCEAKGYRYTLHTASERPIWNRRYAHHVWTPLNVGAMRDAAALLVGEHDFAAFAAAGHGRLSTVRAVHQCEVTRLDETTVAIDVSGAGFLWNMVRIIAGTLVEVGRGRRTAADVRKALESRDRRDAGPTLPPTGLCLMWIRYPEAVFDEGAELPMTRGRRRTEQE